MNLSAGLLKHSQPELGIGWVLAFEPQCRAAGASQPELGSSPLNLSAGLLAEKPPSLYWELGYWDLTFEPQCMHA